MDASPGMLSLSKHVEQILCHSTPITDNNSILWRMLWVLSRFKYINSNGYTETIPITLEKSVKNNWISQF